VIGLYVGFVLINIVAYTLIPIFITKNGATLLNISNLTTIVWSMLIDIFLFGYGFYWLYLLAFSIEVVAILVFSLKSPSKRPP